MWWTYALLSALFAALTAVLAKAGLKNIDSNLATAIRTVVILVLTWSIVFVKGTSGLGAISKRELAFLVLSGLATGASWLFYFKALQLGNLSQVAPVDKLSVALTIILSIIFLHETITIKTALGAALIVSGVLLVIN